MEFTFKFHHPQSADVYHNETKVLTLIFIYRIFEEHPVNILLKGEPFGHMLVLDKHGDIRWGKKDNKDRWMAFGASLAVVSSEIPQDENPALTVLFGSGMLVREES